jgi:non-heme chloroperoxidase
VTRYFETDGLRLAYDDVGDRDGEPIVLLHGFAADRRLNWKLPGWYDTLANAGYRVLALDARGHGLSAKPSDIEAYRPQGIAGDALRLLDHLGLRKACLFGYSMGGRNACWLLAHHGRRFRAVVIGGTGLNLLAPADARRWAKRGFALTRDNANTESLAVPAMVPLYRRAVQRGGRTGARAGAGLAMSPMGEVIDAGRVGRVYDC